MEDGKNIMSVRTAAKAALRRAAVRYVNSSI